MAVNGHSHCGAIMGACDGVELGNLTSLLAEPQPALDAVKDPEDPAQRTSKNAEFVDAVTRCNRHLSVDGLRSGSEVLRDLEQQGKIMIVGSLYDVATGEVDFNP